MKAEMVPQKPGRTLLVTTRYPFANVYGGSKRLATIAQAAKCLGDVALVCFEPTGAHRRDLVLEQQLFSGVHLVRRSLPQAVPLTVMHLLRGHPAQEALFFDKRMQARVHELSGDVDRAVFHLIRAGQYLSVSRAPRNILEMTDLLSSAYACAAAVRRRPVSYLYAAESRRCARAEREMANRADATVLVSETEVAQVVASAPSLSGHVHAIPLAVQLCNSAVATPNRAEVRLCFIGAMWYRPNIEACEWFCSDVVPLLRRRYRSFVFDVIGKGPRQVLNRLASRPGVRVHGFVPNLASVIDGCVASVAPMVSGAGMQTKVLDSLATGLPVVCSPVAAGPLVEALGDVLKVCITPGDYVSAVEELRSSVDSWLLLSSRGMRRVQECFGEAHIVDTFVEVLGGPSMGAMMRTSKP